MLTRWRDDLTVSKPFAERGSAAEPICSGKRLDLEGSRSNLVFLILLRAWFVLSVLAVGLDAADRKAFISFFNPPAQPLPLEGHHSYESAVMHT